MIRQAIADWRAGRARRLSSERYERERQERNKELGITEIRTPDGWVTIWYGPSPDTSMKEQDNANAH